VLLPLALLVSIILASSSTNTFVQSLSSVAVQTASLRVKARRNSIGNDQRNSNQVESTLSNHDRNRLDHELISLPDIHLRSPQSFTYDTMYSRSNANSLDEFDEDDDDDEDYDDLIRDGLQNYHTLLHATGSEIVQGELLQHQIRNNRKNTKYPEAQFIQQYDTSSNEMEVLAMNTITEQLPYPVMRTMEPKHPSSTKSSTTKVVKSTTRKNKNPDSYNENLNFAVNGRVSVEEEIYLAQMIQMGVKLHQVKQQLQEQSGTFEISRTEWAKAVNMTPKQLRQTLLAIRKAKHQLVTANIGLVHTVVKQQFGTNAKAVGITMEELVQEGSIGLLRAAELYNPDRGVRFSTYAVTWIKGILLNSHVTELVRVPSREKTKYNKIKKAQSDLMKSSLGGTSATTSEKKNRNLERTTNANIEELASMTGLTVKDVIETQRRMDHISNIYSLDYEQKMHSRSGSDTSSMESTLTKQTSTMYDDDDLMEQMQLQTDIIAAMARNLDAREARLMRLRYGLSSYNDDVDGTNDASAILSGGRTLQECADAMGLSYSRVHQLNERCLKKLRQAAEAQSLEEYLLTIA
jgi:RNA polymerase nonessential primary-like sigma factor